MADDKFRAHIPSLIASAGGTVLAALAGSYLGIAGTFLGLLGGSAVSGTASWWIDRWLRKSAEKAKAKANFRKRHGREPNAEETQVIAAVAEMQMNVKHSRGIPWKMISIISSSALCIALLGIIVIEIIANRTPAQVFQGHGVTLSGTGATTAPAYTPPPSAPASTFTPPARFTHPTPSPSSITPSPTPSITVTPTVTPSVTPSGTSSPLTPISPTTSPSLVPVP